jgi:hypothetical protein
VCSLQHLKAPSHTAGRGYVLCMYMYVYACACLCMYVYVSNVYLQALHVWHALSVPAQVIACMCMYKYVHVCIGMYLYILLAYVQKIHIHIYIKSQGLYKVPGTLQSPRDFTKSQGLYKVPASKSLRCFSLSEVYICMFQYV